ncbi:P-loop containing nucleoside triphosphate hydrolase protein [Flammula alnicola]|nr:P-loop containing nucleoside triphosphate hydrolase protein [Flammula alnicola]
MAKKKKNQLKPVARGFATTSLPKKVAQDAFPDSQATTSGQSPSSEAQPVIIKEQDQEIPAASSKEQLDSFSIEEQSLQNLVDKLQDKTEKEISRYASSIEADRRFSQTLPRLDIDPILRDRIITAVLDSSQPEGQKVFDDAEGKTIARLGINYGILRRLGFTENRVEECLRSISGVELDEAFDWVNASLSNYGLRLTNFQLYLHCPEGELTPGVTEVQESVTLEVAAGITARINQTPPPPTPRMQTDSSQRRPANDYVPNPSGPTTSNTHRNAYAKDTTEEFPPSIKSLILASYGANASTEGDNEDFDESDPTLAYVRLRLQQDDMASQPRSQQMAAQLRYTQQRIDEVRKDYLFDAKEALARYQQERENAERRLLQERLCLPSSGLDSQPNPTIKKAKPPLSVRPPMENTNVFDGPDSDDSSTGMLGFLDGPDAKEITVKGVTFTLRNMDVPKHWSGPMPKMMLRDFVAKADKYAAISYTIISSYTRARRANVTISWHSRKRNEWSMDSIACPEDSQAEQYIATIALHSLTYPLTEGFAASSPTSTNSLPSFRLLPAVYRDLWDELEASRKTRQDLINRTIWDKAQNYSKVCIFSLPDKQLKQVAEKQLSDAYRGNVEIKERVLDSLSLAFRARQTTPAYQQILARRNDLPIAQYREQIIDILEKSQVLVLSGETGCGKSTQVPAFILEDHLTRGKHCKIYCTEPRRISAISLAQRVLESNITRNTRLAFVTNGIALRMLEGGSGEGGQSTAFDEITHLIIDEVHERTIESDFLLIVLKSLLIERPNLKVILMSATVDAEKISSYFGNCETLHVPGRTFPVNVQFLEDAIEYTKWSIPENSPYARRLHDKYYKGKNRPEWTEDAPTIDDDDDSSSDNQKTNVKLEKRYSPGTAITLNTIDERIIPYDLIIRLLEMICYEDQGYKSFSPAILIFMPGLGEIRRLNDLLAEHKVFGSNDFRIYPLHSTLSSESQGAVFDIPPPGVRKIVIATNIAETGITIPDITCVIDTGKHREMRFDEKRQISRLVETFIARSNAAQRRGRAGRVQQGLCFHLFTKMRHDTQMADSPLPEMMRLSLSDLALRIKIMKIKLGTSIEDVLARAMDPPISINVQRAVSMLVEVRALTPNEEITPMGRLLSKLPTDQEADRAKNSFRTENSDFLTIHNAFSSWRRASANPGFARNFCRTNFLSHQNLQQIEDLRQQFLGYLIDSSFIQVDKSMVRELSRARYVRNRTRFVAIPPELDVNSNNPMLINAALAAGLYPKILSIDPKNSQMRTITNNQHASFHPSSVNFGRNVKEFGVNHLAYFTLMHSKKLYAWETGPVDDLSILLLCGECDFKLISDTVSIDRKIKFSIPPKTCIAIKVLREQLNSLLALQYQGKTLTDLQGKWMDAGLFALSRTKLGNEKEILLGLK